MIIITTALGASTLILATYVWHLRKSITEKKHSKELAEFIHDLSRGSGMLMVRVDPENILIRSPRD